MSKRILFLHHCGARGGAGIMLANIIRALDPQKYQSLVVSPPGDALRDFELAGAEVRVAPRPVHIFRHASGLSWPAWSPRFLTGAILQQRDIGFWERYFRESGADIVHLNSLVLAPVAVAARRAGIPAVCLFQETMVRGTFGLRTAWLRHLLSTQMAAVVFISEYDRRQARCCASITEVIPNWVDLGAFDRSLPRADARERLGLPGNAEVVLFLGGVSQVKGTLVLLQAADILRKRPELLVLIGGYCGSVGQENAPAPLWVRLRRLLRMRCAERIAEFHSGMVHRERVRFVGMLDDVVPYYAAADVVVFPAMYPHQARPVLEAGAMARPVVVSDFECTREFVVPGRNGLVFPAGRADALAGAIGEILDDPQLARRLGEENYRITCEHHDGRRNAASFAAIYDRVAAMGDRAGAADQTVGAELHV